MIEGLAQWLSESSTLGVPIKLERGAHETQLITVTDRRHGREFSVLVLFLVPRVKLRLDKATRLRMAFTPHAGAANQAPDAQGRVPHGGEDQTKTLARETVETVPRLRK